MSIYKRGDIYWIRLERKGQIIQESTGKEAKREAKLYEAARRLETWPELDGGTEVPTLSAFTRELFPYWRRELKPRTKDYYVDSLSHVLDFPDLANAKLNNITPRVIERYKSHKAEAGVGIFPVNHSLRSLRRSLNLAADVFGYAFKVPKISINVSAEKKRDYVVTETNFQRLLENCGLVGEQVAPTVRVREGAGRQTMQALLTVLYDCGLRATEACTLTWDRVNLMEGWVFIAIGKTQNARRKIPLTTRACRVLGGLLNAAREDVPYVFTRYNGHQALSTGWASHEFLRIRRKISLPDGCVMHSLRHSTATRLGNKGCTTGDLMKLMGWATPAMAMRYTHLDETRMNQIVSFLEA